jgi:hypothetical protein
MQNLISSPDVFTRLSFYESSFHFFINRTKFFTSLKSNVITSLPQKKNTTIREDAKLFNLINFHKFSTSLGLKSKYLTNQTLSANTLNYNTPYVTNSVLSNSTGKDIIIIKQDRDLLTQRNLDIIYNITKSTASTPQRINVFDYTNFSTHNDSVYFDKQVISKVKSKQDLLNTPAKVCQIR